MKKLNFRDASISNLYQLNGLVPVHKAIPFGLQHILAMFVANIAPILIVGGACGLASSETAMLIQSAMLIAGIGTLIQLFPIFHKVGFRTAHCNGHQLYLCVSALLYRSAVRLRCDHGRRSHRRTGRGHPGAVCGNSGSGSLLSFLPAW
ncbi:MAG: solute carrier family 23 protein [Ruminococcus sp.]